MNVGCTEQHEFECASMNVRCTEQYEFECASMNVEIHRHVAYAVRVYCCYWMMSFFSVY